MGGGEGGAEGSNLGSKAIVCVLDAGSIKPVAEVSHEDRVTCKMRGCWRPLSHPHATTPHQSHGHPRAANPRHPATAC